MPTALYYLLRLVEASVCLALVVSTLVSALPSLWALLHRRRANARVHDPRSPLRRAASAAESADALPHNGTPVNELRRR